MPLLVDLSSLSEVEVIAETRFEPSAKKSSLIYQWEGHGLRLQLPEGSACSFGIKAVQSSRFELPKGTELVSPVYLVSSEGEVGGAVGVELQHCARVKEEEQWSGLSFVVCKVEKAEPPYQFELCEGQFRSSSSYGKMELEFSTKLVAIVRILMGWGPTADFMFQAKLYYLKQQQSTTLLHFVIVPRLDISTKVNVVCEYNSNTI